jgi:hypothetical protein
MRHFISKDIGEDGDNSTKEDIIVDFIESWVAREKLVGRMEMHNDFP